MKEILVVFSLLLLLSAPLPAESDCEAMRGANIIAQDNDHTYLGKIANSIDPESIFNSFGAYGDPLSDKSIWNEFAAFGNTYNGFSPFNESSYNPPMIVRNGAVIGYLSVNAKVDHAISPESLQELCKDAL